MNELQDLVEQSPAIQDVLQAINAIHEAQEKIESAKSDLAQAFYTISIQVEDRPTLRDEIVRHLYWLDEVQTQVLAENFGLSKTEVNRISHGKYNAKINCSGCGKVTLIPIRSKTHFATIQHDVRFYGYTCDECKQRRSEESEERYRKDREEREHRLYELRTMPYQEYLQSPEWQQRRSESLKRARYRCQVCNTGNTQLNVHHRTYERRGNENQKDLIVLCRECHETFHKRGKIQN